jgi:hypothetical protein|tara:strand:+ start:468 stop:953 length:486 start_codon:yes stop_codon:yes gene_type:complete
MLNNENPLENALNIEPTEVRKTTPEVSDTGMIRREPVKVDLSKFPERKKMDQRKDYGEVRENLKDVIENSKIAIDGILKVASESDSPRAYEVVSQLLKTSTEANKELLDVHKQMKDLEKDETKKQVTNNAFFVGSTKELQELVQQQIPKKKVKKIRNDGEA